MKNQPQLARLLKHKKFLSPKEQQIVNYLYQNLDNLNQLTVTILAEELHIGMSVIYRLIHKLGYRSFRSLIHSLTTPESEIVENKNRTLIDHKLNVFYQELLDRNYRAIEPEKILRTISLLNHASIIYLLGWATGALSAGVLATRLNRLGYASFALDSDDNALVKLHFANNKDLVIIFNFEADRALLNTIINIIDEKKIHVIFINFDAPPKTNYQYVINHQLIPSKLPNQLQIKLSPLISFLYFSDYLVNQILNFDKTGIRVKSWVESNNLLQEHHQS